MVSLSYHEAKKILEQQQLAEEVMKRYERLKGAHAEHGFTQRRELIQVLEDIEAADRMKQGGNGQRGLSFQRIEEIRKLKAEGKSNAEISRQTGTSPITVAKYVGGTRPKSQK
jgi:DNA-binding NarL/FixJ family response regulator